MDDFTCPSFKLSVFWVRGYPKLRDTQITVTPPILKEGQTSLRMNRTKMADGSTAIHDLITKNHSQSLLSQNTSLYLCTGMYVKMYVKLFIHRKRKFPSTRVCFPRIELFISEKCVFIVDWFPITSWLFP